MERQEKQIPLRKLGFSRDGFSRQASFGFLDFLSRCGVFQDFVSWTRMYRSWVQEFSRRKYMFCPLPKIDGTSGEANSIEKTRFFQRWVFASSQFWFFGLFVKVWSFSRFCIMDQNVSKLGPRIQSTKIHVLSPT